MSFADAELAEGDRLLDRYTIVDRAGSGGMASIYRAMDERLDRIVCVKLLRLELEGSGSTSGRNVYEASYTHFQQEALALSRLRHPNTLRIYDFGYLPTGRPFQISEFLEGGNLEEQVKARGKLSHAEVSAILERICGAVDEAHSQKIIHRDIKPSNILFGKVGDQMLPKLADFGIAHSNLKKRRDGEHAHVDGDDDETTGKINTIALFSPRWAAPEQLAGTRQTETTDVYALGHLAFYMLTGGPLFQGNDVRETFGDRVRGDALIGKILRDAQLPTQLQQVLMTSMAARPENRYPTPKAFFEAIRDPLLGAPPPPHSHPTLSRPATPPSSKPRSARELPPEPTRKSDPPGSLHGLLSRARRVDVQENVDLSFVGPKGDAVRFRVSLVPSHVGVRLNIKGLNCFVSKGGRPTPAIVADADGTADLISSAWEPLGRIGWSFGEPTSGPAGSGRAFRLSDGEMMVPSSQAANPVAIFLGTDGDVVVMCAQSW